VSILRGLLLELLKVVGLNAETVIKSHDLAELTPEALFGVLLYHRWLDLIFLFFTCFVFQTGFL
jgi:hypothetical protein